MIKRVPSSRFASPEAFHALLVIASLLGLSSCAGSSGEEFDQSTLVLHLDYRSGGDAPLGFLMSFFEDGRIRFQSPRWKVLWSELSEVEGRHLQTLLQSPEFRQTVEIQTREGPEFGCCDAHELGIFLGPEAKPATVWFNSSEPLPKQLYELLRYMNKVGEEHFGRRFSLLFSHESIEARKH